MVGSPTASPAGSAATTLSAATAASLSSVAPSAISVGFRVRALSSASALSSRSPLICFDCFDMEELEVMVGSPTASPSLELPLPSASIASVKLAVLLNNSSDSIISRSRFCVLSKNCSISSEIL